MGKTIAMQFIQYMNFFEKMIGLRTGHCFCYNDIIFFVVNPSFVARAVGENGLNVKRLATKLRRRVRIIASPDGIKDAEKFVSFIIYPIKFKRFSIDRDEACIIANRQSKAMIIGRNKTRLAELENILKEYFGIKKLRVI